MAAVALTVQPVTVTGAATPPQAATATEGFTARLSRSGLAVLVFNGSGAGMTATVVVPGQLLGQNLPDIAVSVPAGSWRAIKLDRQMVDPETGLVTISLSAFSSITAALIQV